MLITFLPRKLPSVSRIGIIRLSGRATNLRRSLVPSKPMLIGVLVAGFTGSHEIGLMGRTGVLLGLPKGRREVQAPSLQECTQATLCTMYDSYFHFRFLISISLFLDLVFITTPPHHTSDPLCIDSNFSWVLDRLELV